MNQTEIVNLEDLVPSGHMYRKFITLWSFNNVTHILSKIEIDNNYSGYGLLRLFKCLLLQFMEDVSDHELEQLLQENMAARWFCNFSLSEETPNYSLFSKLRKKIGTERLSEIFSDFRNQLKANGVMSDEFNFVDTTHLIAKAILWDEKDKAIAVKYEKLNNEALNKVAYDVQRLIMQQTNYIHPHPKNQFNRPELNQDKLDEQLEFLTEDWGQEYINRI